MQAELTQYSVAGWGDGELWTGAEFVLAHDFRFSGGGSWDDGAGDESGGDNSASAHPLEGGGNPPSGTVAAKRAHVGHAFDTTLRGRTALLEMPGLSVAGLVTRLGAFLGGEPVAFDDVPLDLGSYTAFQQAVARTLQAVPRGEVVTYGELAALAGYPGAQRAVGTFCARNRFMFLVPCHRVVGADGIGGYGSAGVGVKRRLLALEGAAL